MDIARASTPLAGTGLTPAERWETALHESAHCVTARAMCGRVLTVTIKPDSTADPPTAGQTLFRAPVAAHPAIFSAGYVASRVLSGLSTDQLPTTPEEAGTSLGDFQNVARLGGAALRRGWNLARKLVTKYQLDIVRLATQLIEKETLTGAEVAEALSVGQSQDQRRRSALARIERSLSVWRRHAAKCL